MQANQAVEANLNMFHLHLSILFQMASRQLLVIVREGHRPVQRPVNKEISFHLVAKPVALESLKIFQSCL